MAGRPGGLYGFATMPPQRVMALRVTIPDASTPRRCALRLQNSRLTAASLRIADGSFNRIRSEHCLAVEKRV